MESRPESAVILLPSNLSQSPLPVARGGETWAASTLDAPTLLGREQVRKPQPWAFSGPMMWIDRRNDSGADVLDLTRLRLTTQT